MQEKFMGQMEKAFDKIVFEFWKEEILKDVNIYLRRVPKQLREQFSKYCTKRTKGRYKYIMATINFVDGAMLDVIRKKVKKICKKIWVNRAMYCYEWRNEDTGLHVHMKIELVDGKKPYDCKREIYNTVKHIVGNKMHVNLRYSNVDDCFENYIKGIKRGHRKKNYDNDVINRKKHKMKEYYEYCKPVVS